MESHLISTDGIIFRKATAEEIREIEIKAAEEQIKKEEALKKELSNDDIVFIKSLIAELERQKTEIHNTQNQNPQF